MFSEILAECIYYMNEKEKYMTCYEKQKLIEKWEKNKKNDK